MLKTYGALIVVTAVLAAGNSFAVPAGRLKDSSQWTREYIANIFEKASPAVRTKDFELVSPQYSAALAPSCRVYGEDVADSTSVADGWRIRPSFQFRFDVGQLYLAVLKNYSGRAARVLTEYAFFQKQNDYVFTGGFFPYDATEIMKLVEIIENVGPSPEGFIIIKHSNSRGIYTDFGGPQEPITITVRKSGTTMVSRYVNGAGHILGYKICASSNLERRRP